MQEVTRLGLDVHKDTIAVATLRQGQEIPEEKGHPEHPGDPALTRAAPLGPRPSSYDNRAFSHPPW